MRIFFFYFIHRNT